MLEHVLLIRCVPAIACGTLQLEPAMSLARWLACFLRVTAVGLWPAYGYLTDMPTACFVRASQPGCTVVSDDRAAGSEETNGRTHLHLQVPTAGTGRRATNRSRAQVAADVLEQYKVCSWQYRSKANGDV